jgi:hypothetical protein
MDVRVHNIESVWEELDFHGEDYKFVTRTLRIMDNEGKEYTLTMFSSTVDNLISTKTRITRHD